MTTRRRAYQAPVLLAISLVFTATALGIPLVAVGADGQEGATREIPAQEVLPRNGTVSVVDTFDQAPEPASPGATGTEAKLNTGRVPPVPSIDGGVAGQGLTEPSVIAPPGAQGEESPNDLLFASQPIVAAKNAGTTAEPQIAIKGERLLVAWNWGTALSSDGGATFRYLDPYTAFPSAADGFCCDQLTAYLPQHDVWVWILQYLPTPGPKGSNVLRIAIAQGDEAFDAGEFTFFDLTAQEVGLPDGIWLDQPKLGWTDDALFLSVNGFRALPPDGDGLYETAIVWRLLIDRLLAGALSGGVITTEGQRDADDFPIFGPYPIRDSGSTMFLAGHVDNATLGIWTWDDGSESPAFRKVTGRVPTGEPLIYPRGPVPSCPAQSPADPTTSDWCAFSTDRIKTGWVRGDLIGFSWNVPQGAGWDIEFPWVWAVEIDAARIDDCEDGGCVAGYPTIRLADRAIQYAAIAHNAAGDLGGVALGGGGGNKLTCYALSRPRDTPPGAAWNIVPIAQSDVDSPEARSGDYLGAAPVALDSAVFVGSCMTLHAADQAATAAGLGPTAAHIRIASFGQREDLER